MKLEWIGHACFRMTAQDGTVVITDPYDETVGAKMTPLEADLITMSHEHHDHNDETMIVGQPVILHGVQEAAVGGVAARAFASYHDDAKGAKRGANAIRVFEIDGLKVVHMGDQGCMPAKEILDAIAGADVLLIPVGGTYTLDAKEAKDVIERVNPKCVVPMHVKTKGCGYPIAKVGAFLELMGAAGMKPVAVLDVTQEIAPHGVVLMQPQADDLL